MLDCTRLTSPSTFHAYEYMPIAGNFHAYEYRPIAGNFGIFRCNPKLRSCRNERFRAFGSGDSLNLSGVCDSVQFATCFHKFGSRTPKLGFSRSRFQPRRRRDEVYGKTNGGDLQKLWDVGDSGGLGNTDGRIWITRCSFEEDRELNQTRMLGEIDGGILFARGGLPKNKEPTEKSDKFSFENYNDKCSLKPRNESNLSGKMDGGDSTKSLDTVSSDGRESFEKNTGERDNSRSKNREVDQNNPMHGLDNCNHFGEVFGGRMKRGLGATESIPLDQIMASKAEEKILSNKPMTVNREDSSVSSDSYFLEMKRDLESEESTRGSGAPEDNDLISSEASARSNAEFKERGKLVEGAHLRRQRQVLRRSNVLAKQVISVQSALSLGFVSQIWVDTRLWVVLLVEVRPSMLSGEVERFLLEDICQVGDVVLVPDESVVDNEFKMIGLDTLVGYNVITSSRQVVGKVRGFTFNINSGAVELLELDSFGISIIPSSLVSTYGLFVEDVLQVMSDTIVVHKDAVSRMQRLTKGFWDTRTAELLDDECMEYRDLERRPIRSNSNGRRGRRRNFNSQKFTVRREPADDWELPMDY